ncbi:MAG: aminoglycoside phosphotransferase family protein [Oscillospiraceae bacterium]|nr:aminoglycoside phosphotransferase family protein [Oscillospiraceae bacterium]
MNYFLETIGKKFHLSGNLLDSKLLTNGGIHDSYQVIYLNPDFTKKYYIFQKMNRIAFQNPEIMMQNIAVVANYLKNNYPDMQILEFYQTENQNYFYQNFRVMNFIQGENMRICNNLVQIQQAGKAFGQFHARLSGLDSTKLKQTIPNFHATPEYMKKLKLFENQNLPELKILESMQERACEIFNFYQNKKLPFRIVHNDMKCSNLLFHKFTGKAIVIDWDTISNGMLVYDFGDAVRSFASKTVSDDLNFNAIGIDLQKFQAFATGYLQETKNFLTPEEKSVLVQAVFTVTVELATRYLLDYLQGNIYFKISYPEHNLIRARNQIELAKNISANAKAMQEIILNII